MRDTNNMKKKANWVNQKFLSIILILLHTMMANTYWGFPVWQHEPKSFICVSIFFHLNHSVIFKIAKKKKINSFYKSSPGFKEELARLMVDSMVNSKWHSYYITAEQRGHTYTCLALCLVLHLHCQYLWQCNCTGIGRINASENLRIQRFRETK